MVRKCNLSEGDLGCSGHLGWALLGTVPRAQPGCTVPGQFKPWGRSGHEIAHSRSRYLGMQCRFIAWLQRYNVSSSLTAP